MLHLESMSGVGDGLDPKVRDVLAGPFGDACGIVQGAAFAEEKLYGHSDGAELIVGENLDRG